MSSIKVSALITFLVAGTCFNLEATAKSMDIHTNDTIKGIQGDARILSQPYLDEEGNICQDKIEITEQLEYEEQIECQIEFKEKCDSEEEEGEVCHTVTVQECETEYRPHVTQIKVRVCPNSIEVDDASKDDKEYSVVMDVRPTPKPKFTRQVNCVKGKRAICVTKYETMCFNKEVQQEMTEDYPACRVEMVEKCDHENEPHEEDYQDDSREEGFKLRDIIPRKKDECRKVPAMRCKIEKRIVIKTKPETTCNRVPRQFCRKETCREGRSQFPDEELCYFRMQEVNEIVPQKACVYVPQRICHKTNNNSSSSSKPSTGREARFAGKQDNFLADGQSHSSTSERKGCRRIPEERCSKFRGNPRPVLKEVKKRLCRVPRPDISPLDSLLLHRLRSADPVPVGRSETVATTTTMKKKS